MARYADNFEKNRINRLQKLKPEKYGGKIIHFAKDQTYYGTKIIAYNIKIIGAMGKYIILSTAKTKEEAFEKAKDEIDKIF